MTNQILRKSFIAIVGAMALAGCTVTVPEGGFTPGPVPGPGPGPGPGPIEQPAPEQPSILLQTSSFYSGRDSSGKRIRALARRTGEVIVLTSQTGANFTRTYRYKNGNTYKNGNDTIQVTSSRSFVWEGPFGRVVMND